MTTDTGPLIPRRRLGAAFRELREARGETLQRAAKTLMFSPSKLSRIENGQGGEPHPRDVRDILAHFEINSMDDARYLEGLAEQGRVPGWWQVPPYTMPSRLDTFISYESAASCIEAYVAVAIPAMLQTREYAAACIHRLAPHLSLPEVHDQTELRLERQRRLRDRAAPPQQLHVLPETVLHRRVGTRDQMKDQLSSLICAFDDPSLELHVIPFTHGLYEAAGVSNLTVFGFAEESDPDVVALERVQFIQFTDRSDSVDKYRRVFANLSHYWLNRSESRAFIERLRKNSEEI